MAGAGATALDATSDPLLYQHYREGTFGYDIPLENGRYEVTLGFVEPDERIGAGQRVFDVRANGARALEGFEILAAAGGKREAVVTRSFPVQVSNGRLQLDFVPTQGEAVVSTISIRKP